MNKDPLRAYMKHRTPQIPPTPVDEWPRILARTKARPQKTWLYVSAVTLAAAGLLAMLNQQNLPDPDARLEVEDVIYGDQSEIIDRGAYGDWLLLADSVDADGND